MFKNNFSINAPFTLFDYIAVNPNININSDFVSRFRQVSLNADDEVEFNHNHPHSLGGRTDVTNGAVVHKSCNRKLGSKFPELQFLNAL